MQIILQANYGSSVANDMKNALDEYQHGVEFLKGVTNETATAGPDKIRELRLSVLVKSCLVVSWTGSLPFLIKSVSTVVDDKHLHADLCEYRPIFQLAAGRAVACTADVRSSCVDLMSLEIAKFETIAPGGDTLPFAVDVRSRTNALLQQLQTVVLPFLFGMIGGFLAVLFNPNPGFVHLEGPEGEAIRYLLRPFIGGVAGLLICVLIAGTYRAEPSYSINIIGLLAGYGLELLPMVLNAGVVAMRAGFEKAPKHEDQVRSDQDPKTAHSIRNHAKGSENEQNL